MRERRNDNPIPDAEAMTSPSLIQYTIQGGRVLRRLAGVSALAALAMSL